MIITCNECSTSFRLDDSLVRENGSKVRCSVCKNVFTAYPLHREPEQTDEVLPKVISEPAPAFDDISGFEMEDTDFSLKDSDLEIENQDLVLEDSEFTSEDLEHKDTDLSFEENDFDLNIGDDEKIPDEKEFEFEAEDISIDTGENKDTDFDGIEFEPMQDESEEITLSMEESETGEAETEDEFELEFDVADDSTDSLSSDLSPDTDESPLETLKEPEIKEEKVSLENNETDEKLAEIIPEDDFSDYDSVLELDTQPEDTGDKEDIEEDVDEDVEEEMGEKEITEERPLIEKMSPLIDLPQRSSRRKKKPLISLPVLMLLLIFFLTAGAYVASIMTGYKIPHFPDVNIPFLEKYLKKDTPAAMDQKPVPNENSVNGRFVSNNTSGTLFVITGRVDNPSGLSFSRIEVQGTLSTKEIPLAKTKNAFCGNIITEEQLKSGDITEMMKQLEAKEGNHNSNMNIKPGAGVPFMIIFSDLPEKLQNFNVKVVGFEKASGN